MGFNFLSIILFVTFSIIYNTPYRVPAYSIYIEEIYWPLFLILVLFLLLLIIILIVFIKRYNICKKAFNKNRAKKEKNNE